MPLVSFDNEVAQTEQVEILPPFATYEFFVNVPFSFLGRNTPENITVSVEGKELTIPSFKRGVIIYNLVFIFVLVAIASLVILIRLKKLNFGDFRVKIRRIFKRDEKPNTETNAPGSH